MALNTRGIKHNSELAAHSLGRKISLELSSNYARISMSSSDFAPDGSDFGTELILGLALIDIDDSLSKIKFGLFSFIDSLDFDESSVGVLVHLRSSRSKTVYEKLNLWYPKKTPSVYNLEDEFVANGYYWRKK